EVGQDQLVLLAVSDAEAQLEAAPATESGVGGEPRGDDPLHLVEEPVLHLMGSERRPREGDLDVGQAPTAVLQRGSVEGAARPVGGEDVRCGNRETAVFPPY